MANVRECRLYDGDVTLLFYEDSHRYKHKDKTGWIDSVTSITSVLDKSRSLIPWAVNCVIDCATQHAETRGGPFGPEQVKSMLDDARNAYERKRMEAASIGTRVHEWALSFAKGLSPAVPEDPAVRAGVQAFLTWYTSHDVKFIETERLVYSRIHDYAGIFDALATVNGRKTLIDYKTSKGIYPEMFFQLAGYSIACMEEFGDGYVDDIALLHFDKETGVPTVIAVPKENRDEDVRGFLACHQLKRAEKSAKRRIGSMPDTTKQPS